MSWNKVEKEKTDSTKVDRTDYGWFRGGWFYNWLSGVLWKKVIKSIENWTKITKE